MVNPEPPLVSPISSRASVTGPSSVMVRVEVICQVTCASSPATCGTRASGFQFAVVNQLPLPLRFQVETVWARAAGARASVNARARVSRYVRVRIWAVFMEVASLSACGSGAHDDRAVPLCSSALTLRARRPASPVTDHFCPRPITGAEKWVRSPIWRLNRSFTPRRCARSSRSSVYTTAQQALGVSVPVLCTKLHAAARRGARRREEATRGRTAL